MGKKNESYYIYSDLLLKQHGVIPAYARLLEAGCNDEVTEMMSLSKSEFRPRCHSSESWNPVVYVIHSRPGGNDN